eukprot:gene5615-1004_t
MPGPGPQLSEFGDLQAATGNAGRPTEEWTESYIGCGRAPRTPRTPRTPAPHARQGAPRISYTPHPSTPSAGKVFAGTIDGILVAIKVIQAGSQVSPDTFQAEVASALCVRHPNVVPLLSVCVSPLCLVYPRLPRTLTAALWGQPNPRPLPWQARLARITDFGVARPDARGDGNTTRVMGTLSHMCPAYMNTGKVYFDSDIYSLGVMLTEVLCGVAAGSWGQPVEEVLDPDHGGGPALWQSLKDLPTATLTALVELALSCVSHTRKQRPSAVQAATALASLLPTPASPATAQPAPPLRECIVCMSIPVQTRPPYLPFGAPLLRRTGLLMPHRAEQAGAVFAPHHVRGVHAKAHGSSTRQVGPPAREHRLCPTCREVVQSFEVGAFDCTFQPPSPGATHGAASEAALALGVDTSSASSPAPSPSAPALYDGNVAAAHAQQGGDLFCSSCKRPHAGPNNSTCCTKCGTLLKPPPSAPPLDLSHVLTDASAEGTRNNAKAHLAHGNVLRRSSDYAGAKTAYLKAVQADPNHAK